MNFNPFDLILIKESLYDVNSIPNQNISEFITKLINIQQGDIKMEDQENDKYWERFYQKQEMIELAFQINKTEPLKRRGT